MHKMPPTRLKMLLPAHPIARGVPVAFDIPHTEMYDEPFHVPAPDEVIFEQSGLAPDVQKKLEAMGYTMKERGHLADAPAIGRDGAEWVGVAEPRRVGGLASAP